MTDDAIVRIVGDVFALITQHRSWRGRELLTIWSTDLSMTRATIFSMPKPSATGATSNNNRR